MEIIYEDESVLIVSKPAGQVVNRAKTIHGARTLQDELEEYFGERLTTYSKQLRDGAAGGGTLAENFLLRAGIVHRLDKETSGILVVAKTPEALADLQVQFKQRKVRKEYLALIHGKIKDLRGRVEAPLGRNPKNRMRFDVVAGGRSAVTEYEVVRRWSVAGRGEFSYLRVRPLTGRTHQIRVHLKHIGHPIVSDPLYLSRKQWRRDRRWCPRIFLHAESLGFKHPRSGAWVRFEVELPEDLQEALATIGN